MDVADLLAVAAAYLIGSVDFGVIVPRLAGVDIFSVGSGNPGTTNVLRTMGRAAAAGVLAGDVAKGFAAALVGDLVGGAVVGFAAACAAVVGHCFPVWHRFHGGKGVAAAGGATLWLEPLFGLALVAGWAGAVAATRRASVASMLVAVAYVPGLALFGHRGWRLGWAGAAAAIILVRHQSNIRRLLGGAEHTIGETA